MVRIDKEMWPTIGLCLSIVGIIIWLILILTTRIWWVDPKYELGLYQVMPVYFWLALLLHLAGTLIGIKINKRYLFIFQIIVLNLMVWGTPVFVEPNARNLDAWQWLGTTRTIIESGHINVNDSPTHYYLQWPGSFIFNAISLLVTSADPLIYMQFYPLLTSVLFILFFYLWIRNLVKDKVICRYSVVLLIFLNVWLQFHFSPQAFGLMLLPLILIAIGKKGFAWRAVMVILIATLIISHPTTTLFLLMIIICQELVKVIMRIKKEREKKSLQQRKLLIRFVVIIFVCSMIIIINLLLFYKNFSRIFNLGEAMNMLSSIFTSRIQRPSSLIRMGILIFAMFAVVFTIFHYKKNFEKKFIFSAGWLLGCIVPIFWDLTMEEGHFHDRSLMFAYMLIPLLLVHFFWLSKRLTKFKHIGITLVILISLLGVYGLYPNENWAIVSDSNLATTHHLLEYHNHTRVYSSKLGTVYAHDPEFDIVNFYGYTKASGNSINASSVVVFDKYSMSLQTTTGRYVSDSYKEYESEDNNRIYDNSKFIIYLTGG